MISYRDTVMLTPARSCTHIHSHALITYSIQRDGDTESEAVDTTPSHEINPQALSKQVFRLHQNMCLVLSFFSQ